MLHTSAQSPGVSTKKKNKKKNEKRKLMLFGANSYILVLLSAIRITGRWE